MKSMRKCKNRALQCELSNVETVGCEHVCLLRAEKARDTHRKDEPRGGALIGHWSIQVRGQFSLARPRAWEWGRSVAVWKQPKEGVGDRNRHSHVEGLIRSVTVDVRKEEKVVRLTKGKHVHVLQGTTRLEGRDLGLERAGACSLSQHR